MTTVTVGRSVAGSTSGRAVSRAETVVGGHAARTSLDRVMCTRSTRAALPRFRRRDLVGWGGTGGDLAIDPPRMTTPSDLDVTPGDAAIARRPGLTPEHDALNLPRDEVKRRSLAGVFFLTFSSFFNLIVGFAASLVLARLLTPEDFGVVAVGSTA